MLITTTRSCLGPVKIGTGLHNMSNSNHNGRPAKRPIHTHWSHSEMTDFESSEGFSLNEWTPQYTRTADNDGVVMPGSIPWARHVKPPHPSEVACLDAVSLSQDPKPAEFHRFMELPYELRTQIWQMYMRQCRLVVISGACKTTNIHCRKNRAGQYYSNVSWSTQNRSPIMMRVCRETRAEAVRFYRIHLPLNNKEPYSMAYDPRNPFMTHAIIINPEWDMVLYLPESAHVPTLALLNDLAAWDPQLEGAHHFGVSESPVTPFRLETQLGLQMLNLSEATMCLKTWMVWIGHFDRRLLGFSEGVFGQMRDESYVEGMKVMLAGMTRKALEPKLCRWTKQRLVTVRASMVPFYTTMDSSCSNLNCDRGIEMIWEDTVGWTGSRMTKFLDKPKTKSS